MSAIYKIVVLLSTYNGEQYLEEQLNSLFCQTVAQEMLIFVRDDGSSDKTIAILQKYQDEGLLRYYNGNNLGSAQSFLQLLQDAPDANYYAFCDQDDFWLPNKLEAAIGQLDKNNTETPLLYCSRKTIVDENLKDLNKTDPMPWESLLDTMIRWNYAFGCTMVMNKSMQNLINIYHKPNILWHDGYIYRLGMLFGKVIIDPKSYILYRQHGNNASGANLYGTAQLIRRIKTFDFTLKKYKNNKEASNYAKTIWNGYKDLLKDDERQLVYDVANVRENTLCRQRLLSKAGLTFFPSYEYFAYKIFILLGWL